MGACPSARAPHVTLPCQGVVAGLSRTSMYTTLGNIGAVACLVDCRRLWSLHGSIYSGRHAVWGHPEGARMSVTNQMWLCREILLGYCQCLRWSAVSHATMYSAAAVQSRVIIWGQQAQCDVFEALVTGWVLGCRAIVCLCLMVLDMNFTCRSSAGAPCPNGNAHVPLLPGVRKVVLFLLYRCLSCRTCVM